MNEEARSGSTHGQRITHDVVSLIETGLGPDKCSIYIGGTTAARDIGLIRERNITTVVNCAVNLDINYVSDPVERTDGNKCAHGVGPVRVFKLGLVDGHGNTEDMMLASYLLLDGAIRQVIPEKPTYPLRKKGNILVHCRGGRSRSTALVALYLHLNRSGKFPTLNSALAHVREKRGLHPDEWSTAPKPMLVKAAQLAAEKFKKIS
ncbi:MAG: dual specificity protein phosphatase [Albidovulum sp.]|nr:dual specificity protein phosphatase [Albidovulum sp.]